MVETCVKSSVDLSKFRAFLLKALCVALAILLEELLLHGSNILFRAIVVVFQLGLCLVYILGKFSVSGDLVSPDVPQSEEDKDKRDTEAHNETWEVRVNIGRRVISPNVVVEVLGEVRVLSENLDTRIVCMVDEINMCLS